MGPAGHRRYPHTQTVPGSGGSSNSTKTPAKHHKVCHKRNKKGKRVVVPCTCHKRNKHGKLVAVKCKKHKTTTKTR